MLTVKDIMTKEAVFVSPDALLTDAARIIVEKNFDGVPVVNEEKKLVGILTQYDLISKGSALHLPTMQFILEHMAVFKKDKKQFQENIQEITSLRVHDVMNPDPLTFQEGDTYEYVVHTFRDHHRVNPIPVVDTQRYLVGVVSRYDILKFLKEF
jgi:CBS domain-containing protein